MVLSSAIVLTTLSSAFCLALDPNALEMEELRQGVWLMGAAWCFGAWSLAFQATHADVPLATVGKKWLTGLQQRCANRGHVLASQLPPGHHHYQAQYL